MECFVKEVSVFSLYNYNIAVFYGQKPLKSCQRHGAINPPEIGDLDKMYELRLMGCRVVSLSEE
jgi:hypothetical protein